MRKALGLGASKPCWKATSLRCESISTEKKAVVLRRAVVGWLGVVCVFVCFFVVVGESGLSAVVLDHDWIDFLV